MNKIPNNTLKEREDEVIEEFAAYDDWMDRYQYLVDLGNELPPLPEGEKNDTTLIKGCQSNVWLTCAVEGDRIFFSGESDAVIVRGVVALLIRVMSGSTLSEVIGSEYGFIDAIGLREHLSANRSNGLVAMMNQIKSYAVAASMKRS